MRVPPDSYRETNRKYYKQMKISIRNIINPTLPASVLLIFICLGMWITSFVLVQIQPTAAPNSVVSSFAGSNILSIPLVSFVIAIVFTFFNGFLIAQLNNKFTLIRNRTFLPVIIFLFVISLWPDLHLTIGTHVATTLTILSLFMFLSMYRNRQSSEQAYSGSFLISLAGFFVLPVVFLLPVCWIGMIQMKGFSLKTFLASIFGGLTPWILYFSVRFYLQPDLSIFQNSGQFLQFGMTVLERPIHEIVYLLLMLLTMVAAFPGLLSDMNKDSLQTRSYLFFFMVMLVSVFILTLFFPLQYKLLLPLAMVFFTFLISHPISLKQSNFYSILFYVFCLINAGYFVFIYFIK